MPYPWGLHKLVSTVILSRCTSSRLTVRIVEVEGRSLAVASRFEVVAGRIHLGIADRDSSSCRSVSSGCREAVIFTEARGRQEEQADDGAGLLASKEIADPGI